MTRSVVRFALHRRLRLSPVPPPPESRDASFTPDSAAAPGHPTLAPQLPAPSPRASHPHGRRPYHSRCSLSRPPPSPTHTSTFRPIARYTRNTWPLLADWRPKTKLYIKRSKSSRSLVTQHKPSRHQASLVPLDLERKIDAVSIPTERPDLPNRTHRCVASHAVLLARGMSCAQACFQESQLAALRRAQATLWRSLHPERDDLNHPQRELAQRSPSPSTLASPRRPPNHRPSTLSPDGLAPRRERF